MKTIKMTRERSTYIRMLRDRYEEALRMAARRMALSRRGSERRDRLIRAVLRDRLLIPEQEERATLREIARRLKCTPSRALKCERDLIAGARSILRADPVTRHIISLRRQRRRSEKRWRRDAFRREVRRREREAFDAHVGELDGMRLGEVLRDLGERVCGRSDRLAGELYDALSARQRRRVLMELLNEKPPRGGKRIRSGRIIAHKRPRTGASGAGRSSNASLAAS
jgi:hypothetical protein